MIAKLIVWDVDRERATARMRRALAEYEIGGLTTLIPFHLAILDTQQWRDAETCRDLIEDRECLKGLAPEQAAQPAGGDGDEAGELTERTYSVEVDGRLHNVKVIGTAPPAGQASGGGLPRPPRRAREAGGGAVDATSEALVSPLQGTILKVSVEEGQAVESGALVCVIEAMKMENEITAHRDGKITKLSVKEGGSVAAGDVIATIE
jgi:acetyl-CoA/propionyl-CoA carboxylase biotin carboxyl carrier protein